MDVPNGTYELIDPNEIHFDRKYQRPQKWDLIAKIAKQPAWAAFGVIICAKRLHANGLLYALDGQQRLNGVLSAENPPARVPVLWFAVTTVKEEASLFDLINTNRKAVGTLEKFQARLTSENPTYLRIAAAVERAGFTIGANQESPRVIAGVDALQSINNDVGEDGVYLVLASVAAAWPDDKYGSSAVMLRTLGQVAAEMGNNGGLSIEKLSKALARTTPGRVMRKAEEIRFAQGVSKKVAMRSAVKALAKV